MFTDRDAKGGIPSGCAWPDGTDGRAAKAEQRGPHADGFAPVRLGRDADEPVAERLVRARVAIGERVVPDIEADRKVKPRTRGGRHA